MSEAGSVEMLEGFQMRDVPKIIRKELTMLSKHINAIPEEMIHGYEKPDEFNKYKVIKGWWTAVIPLLSIGIAEKIIQGTKLKRKVKTFVKRYRSKNFHKQPRVTTRDIKNANRIITSVLKKL